jgi:hypothetical protein
VRVRSFLNFRFVFFRRDNINTKAAQKMLVKLAQKGVSGAAKF